MKYPWDDDYEGYCRMVAEQGAEGYRAATEALERQLRNQEAWIAQARAAQEERERLYREEFQRRRAERAEAERTWREAQEAKEKAERAAERARQKAEYEARRVAKERYQKRLAREAAARLARRAELQAAKAQMAAARESLQLEDLPEDTGGTGYRGVSEDELPEVTEWWEAAHRLTPEESGYYEAGYRMGAESAREAALVRMAEYHCERLSGKRLYQRPFSQMKLTPTRALGLTQFQRKAAYARIAGNLA